MTPNAKRMLCWRRSPAPAGWRQSPGDTRPERRLLQERRDVEIVVVDLEIGALTAPDLRPARARASLRRLASVLARGAATAAAAVVEAGPDHRHADLVAHRLVDDRA